MFNGKSILAVVPARGGSKGIPHKNLRHVCNKTLIEWTARIIKMLSWIDGALLSTDDEAIAKEGKRHGLEVPFMRPAHLATDDSKGIDVWIHAWLEAEKHWNRTFDMGIYLQPTTPLRRPEHIKKTVEAIMDGDFEAATTVAPVPGHFVPEKILCIDADLQLRPYLQGKFVCNRQEAQFYYYRTGACYAAWRQTIVEKRQLMEAKCRGVIIDEYTINIDDPVELELANLLCKPFAKGLNKSET